MFDSGLICGDVRAVNVLQVMNGVMRYLETTPALRATPPREGN